MSITYAGLGATTLLITIKTEHTLAWTRTLPANEPSKAVLLLKPESCPLPGLAAFTTVTAGRKQREIRAVRRLMTRTAPDISEETQTVTKQRCAGSERVWKTG